MRTCCAGSAQFPEDDVHARDDSAEGRFAAVHEGALALASFLPHKTGHPDIERFRADPFIAILRRGHPPVGRAERRRDQTRSPGRSCCSMTSSAPDAAAAPALPAVR